MPKHIGTIFAHGFTNKCCADKPFLLMVNEDGSFACECECGLWNTSAYKSPVEAIMEYEMMCRAHPKVVQFHDPDIVEKYLKYYPSKREGKNLGATYIREMILNTPQDEMVEFAERYC